MDDRQLVMNLRSVDLNLLVVLDALLTELHVTRAGAKAGLSQSATSSALRRLRGLLNDELLVRTATGMKPTPRALELAEPVRQLLRQAERVLESNRSFDAAKSNLRFRIRMSDVLEFLLLPELLAALREEAPGVTLDIVHLPPAATLAALEADDIDVAVSMGLDHASAVRTMPLLQDRMVCLLEKCHPAAIGEMTLEHFLDAPHLKVSMSPTDGRYVDAALTGIHQARRVVLNVPHWLVVPHLLRHSPMIAVMSERLAYCFADENLVVRNLPFGSSIITWSLYWHRRHDSTPAQIWLRTKLLAIAERP
jgi:DNA-binding transcriptional LysR family regulator